MRIDISTFLASIATLWVVNTSVCLAQEVPRQSPAAKQGAKARAYANRDDGNGQAGTDRTAGEYGNAQEGDMPPGADDAARNKARKDLGETFKDIEKALDLMK